MTREPIFYRGMQQSAFLAKKSNACLAGRLAAFRGVVCRSFLAGCLGLENQFDEFASGLWAVRVRDFSLIRAPFCGISRPGDGASSLLAGKPHARTSDWAA